MDRNHQLLDRDVFPPSLGLCQDLALRRRIFFQKKSFLHGGGVRGGGSDLKDQETALFILIPPLWRLSPFFCSLEAMFGMKEAPPSPVKKYVEVPPPPLD